VRVAAWSLAVVAIARAAAADPSVAAVAAADDARAAVLVGPSGQVYEPDGRGSWTRHHAGGVGDAVDVAVKSGDAVIAGAGEAAAAHAPPFEWRAGVWEAVPVALRAHAVVGRGTRAVVAVNRAVWTLDGTPRQLVDAPAAVTMLGASSGGVAIATATGVFRLDGKQWKPVDRAPAVTMLLDDRWAQTSNGVFDLRAGKPLAWPSQLPANPVVGVDAAGDLVAVAIDPGRGALAIVRLGGGKLEVGDATAIVAAPAAVAGVTTDRAGRVVVAFADGRIAIRDGTAWSATAVRDELPAPRPGSPPATSR
jgi:hypothetical protein